MITLEKPHHIHHIQTAKQSGSILANNKVYTSPKPNSENWDICFKFEYPYNVLCNFTHTGFTHQGVKINSMEGFLQSLKVNDKKTQEKICTLPGFMAKKVGNYLKRSGQFDKTTVYWQGKQYDRNSEEFKKIISEAYKSKHTQDRLFRTVLESSKGHKLTHTIGKNNPMETILTEEEFIENLNTLRKGQSINNKIKSFMIDTKNVLFPKKTTKTIADHLQNNKATFVNDIYVCGEDPLINASKLKKLGVKNIIDINAEPRIAELRNRTAQKHNLKYLNITMDDHKHIENGTEAVKNIVNMYNEGAPTYIIANEKHDANTVLAINYLYNPKSTLADGVMFGTPQKAYIGKLAGISQDMSESDIKSLGWGEKFAETLAERRKTILELNG